MTLASIGGWHVPVPDYIYYPVVTAFVLVITYLLARLLAGIVGERVRRRRGELAVITRRVVYAAVIAVGVFFALGWAAQNSNVTLFGLLLATVVAAQFMFGVDAFVVNVAIPTISVELHASPAEIESVIAIYLIAYESSRIIEARRFRLELHRVAKLALGGAIGLAVYFALHPHIL